MIPHACIIYIYIYVYQWVANVRFKADVGGYTSQFEIISKFVPSIYHACVGPGPLDPCPWEPLARMRKEMLVTNSSSILLFVFFSNYCRRVTPSELARLCGLQHTYIYVYIYIIYIYIKYIYTYIERYI